MFDDITPDVNDIQWAKVRPDKLTPRDPDEPPTDHSRETLLELLNAETSAEIIAILDREAATYRELYHFALDLCADLSAERDDLKRRFTENQQHIATLMGLGA